MSENSARRSGSAEPPSLSVGIDVGGTKSLGVAIDAAGTEVAVERRTTPDGGAALIEMLAGLAEALAVRAGPDHRLGAVGVGVAGFVDLAGRLRRSPNLTDADELAVGELLATRLDLPVAVDNDANCAGRAELHLGAGRGVAQALMITLGTGIGGALVCDGRVVRGAAGMAGEPGHMMVDPAGPECVCGKTGCWERYASGSGLALLAEKAAATGRLGAVIAASGGDVEGLRGEDITRAARIGDVDALAVLDEFAWWVAIGMANCAALTDPELIVVGGGLVREWDLFGANVQQHFAALLAAAEHRPQIRIEPAAAGEKAGALGAALLARELLAQSA